MENMNQKTTTAWVDFARANGWECEVCGEVLSEEDMNLGQTSLCWRHVVRRSAHLGRIMATGNLTFLVQYTPNAGVVAILGPVPGHDGGRLDPFLVVEVKTKADAVRVVEDEAARRGWTIDWSTAA